MYNVYNIPYFQEYSDFFIMSTFQAYGHSHAGRRQASRPLQLGWVSSSLWTFSTRKGWQLWETPSAPENILTLGHTEQCNYIYKQTERTEGTWALENCEFRVMWNFNESFRSPETLGNVWGLTFLETKRYGVKFYSLWSLETLLESFFQFPAPYYSETLTFLNTTGCFPSNHLWRNEAPAPSCTV